jgi:hypothetical protein
MRRGLPGLNKTGPAGKRRGRMSKAVPVAGWMWTTAFWRSSGVSAGRRTQGS